MKDTNKKVYILQSLLHSLKALECTIDEPVNVEQMVESSLEILVHTWGRRDAESEIAFQVTYAVKSSTKSHFELLARNIGKRNCLLFRVC